MLKIVIEAIAIAIGLMVYIGTVTIAYLIGRWVAPHLGWPINADMFGLLCAISVVWLSLTLQWLNKLHR